MKSKEFQKRIVQLLTEIKISEKRDQIVTEFLTAVWGDETLDTGEFDDRLTVLANRMEHYVSNPESRAEDGSYFGDEKLLELVGEFLTFVEGLDTTSGPAKSK